MTQNEKIQISAEGSEAIQGVETIITSWTDLMDRSPRGQKGLHKHVEISIKAHRGTPNANPYRLRGRNIKRVSKHVTPYVTPYLLLDLRQGYEVKALQRVDKLTCETITEKTTTQIIPLVRRNVEPWESAWT